ncbi:MAG: sulfurtransferase [Aggregatilineales bacterium]
MTHLLVTTDWLETHLADPDLRIVDIRGHVLPASDPPPHYFNHRADYDHSHIPGAVFVDWVHEITDPDDPRHAQIARPDRFSAAMSRAGIGPDTFVVAYDDAESMFAARLWWSLNYYGHSAVAVLDGGGKKWISEGRPTTATVDAPSPAPFVAHPNPDFYRNADQVAGIQNSRTLLIDARTQAEFEGKVSRASRKGHIPGAINQPRLSLVIADGQLLPPNELRAKFAQAGIDESTEEVVFYCNGGVSASFGLLALRAAGFNIPGAVYDGSWKDWGNNASRPIE